MFGVITPLCNRMFCCIFGWYFYIAKSGWNVEKLSCGQQSGYMEKSYKMQQKHVDIICESSLVQCISDPNLISCLHLALVIEKKIECFFRNDFTPSIVSSFVWLWKRRHPILCPICLMSEKIAFTYARIARKLLLLGVTYYILHWCPEGAPESIPYGKVSLFSTRFDLE